MWRGQLRLILSSKAESPEKCLSIFEKDVETKSSIKKYIKLGFFQLDLKLLATMELHWTIFFLNKQN